MFKDILREMNLLNEVDSKLAHEKYYSSIPDDIYDRITLGASDIDKLTQYVLNGVRDEDIFESEAIKFIDDFSKSDQLVKQYIKKSLASGEYDGADDMILDFENTLKNGIVTEKMLEKEGYIVIKKTDYWIVTCTSTYTANHHYFGGKTTWCTASDRYGNRDGFMDFKTYTENGLVLIQFSSTFNQGIYQISVDKNGYVKCLCDEKDHIVYLKNLIDLVGRELYDYATGPEVFPVLERKTIEVREKEEGYYEARDRRHSRAERKIKNYIRIHRDHYAQVRDSYNSKIKEIVDEKIKEIFNSLSEGDNVGGSVYFGEKFLMPLSTDDYRFNITPRQIFYGSRYYIYEIKGVYRKKEFSTHPKSTKDEDVLLKTLAHVASSSIKICMLVDSSGKIVKLVCSDAYEKGILDSYNSCASFLDEDDEYWNERGNYVGNTQIVFLNKLGLLMSNTENGAIIKDISNIDLSCIKGDIVGVKNMSDDENTVNIAIFEKLGNGVGNIYFMNENKIYYKLDGNDFSGLEESIIIDEKNMYTDNSAYLFHFGGLSYNDEKYTIVNAPSIGVFLKKIIGRAHKVYTSYISTTENAYLLKDLSTPVFAVENIKRTYHSSFNGKETVNALFGEKRKILIYCIEEDKYYIYDEHLNKNFECDKYGNTKEDYIRKNNVQNWKGYSPEASSEMDKMWKDRQGNNDDEYGTEGTNRKGWNSDENWKKYEDDKKRYDAAQQYVDYYINPQNKEELDNIAKMPVDNGLVKDYDKRYGYRNWHKDNERNVGAFDHFDDPVLREFKDLVRRMEIL